MVLSVCRLSGSDELVAGIQESSLTLPRNEVAI